MDPEDGRGRNDESPGGLQRGEGARLEQSTKLDHESKPAWSPLSSGQDADFDAIIPPNQYPPEVWRALVKRGELESTGQGFFKIPLQRREF